MREFLVRLLLAAAVTLAVFALSSAGNAQQADEDAAPATPHQKQQPTAPAQRSTQTSLPRTPEQKTVAGNSSDEQTQDALAFTGRVVEQRGALVLSDPVTKMIYQLDDPSKAKPYVGKQVKVVGRLEMKSNTIHIDAVERVP